MVQYKLLATGLVIMLLATELQVLLHASMPLLYCLTWKGGDFLWELPSEL